MCAARVLHRSNRYSGEVPGPNDNTEESSRQPAILIDRQVEVSDMRSRSPGFIAACGLLGFSVKWRMCVAKGNVVGEKTVRGERELEGNEARV
jgi:hypothetical protein